jgi:hypothetical protein
MQLNAGVSAVSAKMISTILLIAATLSGLVQPHSEPVPTNSAAMGSVLVIKNPAATRAFAPQAAPIREMINEGLIRFTRQPTVQAAWLSLVTTQDTIGVKVHSAPGRTSGTRPAVVAGFIESLLEAGIPASNIIIWDRRSVDLRLAGYFELAGRYGVRVTGALEEGYDREHFYEAPLIGKLVYGDLEFGQKGEGVGRKSYVSNLLTRRMTKIVNITPLLNHNYAGVSGARYGLAIASVDNILRFEDTQRLSTAIPEIYGQNEIADRVVLNVVDALICQYQGEEQTRLHDSTALNELWFSSDPVAVDVLALQELEREKGDDSRKTPGKLIYTNAGLMELGIADPAKIKVERIPLRK